MIAHLVIFASVSLVGINCSLLPPRIVTTHLSHILHRPRTSASYHQQSMINPITSFNAATQPCVRRQYAQTCQLIFLELLGAFVCRQSQHHSYQESLGECMGIEFSANTL